ncbi:hypothetical protein AB0A69_08055 [Streptomyces sp. NPDC045431]|uniref:hypothetical protein n=1 Tax=Streptomyces sp. NPDC045431 TaxID=3155613 RepID=UPI00340A2B75
MPIIAARVHEFPDGKLGFGHTVKVHLYHAGIPQVVRKEHRSGYEIRPVNGLEEGEVQVLWISYLDIKDDDYARDQEERLREILRILEDKYWVRLDLPGLYRNVNQPTLRVLYDLSWLGK